MHENVSTNSTAN